MLLSFYLVKAFFLYRQRDKKKGKNSMRICDFSSRLKQEVNETIHEIYQKVKDKNLPMEEGKKTEDILLSEGFLEEFRQKTEESIQNVFSLLGDFQEIKLNTDGYFASNVLLISGDTVTINHHDFAAFITDILEDIYEKAGITVPDEDRKGEEGEARLYGETFDMVVHTIEKSLNTYMKEMIEDMNNFPEKKLIQDLYETYQMDWLIHHGYRLTDIIKETFDITSALQKDNERMPSLNEVEDTFYEEGFSGECFVCKEEFMDNEFLDKDYMHGLIENYYGMESVEKHQLYNEILRDIRKEKGELTPFTSFEDVRDCLENVISSSCVIDFHPDGDRYYGIIEFWSDLGEDIPIEIDFDGTMEDFLYEVKQSCENFDVDEHAEMNISMRGQRGVPNDIIGLVKDAEDIQRTMQDIVEAMEERYEEDFTFDDKELEEEVER